MRRIRNLLLALSLVGALALTPGVVGADAHIPPHGHMLVLGVEVGEEGPPTYEKCIDLANNQALRLNAHHEHLHTGTAGEALFYNAGHVVVPTYPFVNLPWTDCASFAQVFGPPTR